MTAAFTVNLDEATLARLEAIAKSRALPRDRVVQEALEAFLDMEEARIARIKEGIAQADRGEFATDAEVERVFSKYRGG
ncbi:CopG family ribbon-helix-helix protein [Chelatococcus sp. GCM10030263]|uniref:CopG family ribbon-helix-helix protein n=1 Tax=Chelatococcus sp. GCM10030263 TaxID=3273387 RepID=UPI003608FF43